LRTLTRVITTYAVVKKSTYVTTLCAAKEREKADEVKRDGGLAKRIKMGGKGKSNGWLSKQRWVAEQREMIRLAKRVGWTS
jgi:hypothetical protein